MGRPSNPEQRRRRIEFVRLIAGGAAFDQAARDAQLSPVRALAILSQPEVRQLISVEQQAA